MIRLLRAMVVVMPLIAVSACVTINIYFPAAAAEKAADLIIDEVWQLHEAPDVPSRSPTEESKP